MKKKELLAAFVLLLYGSHDALGQDVVSAYEGDESVSLPFIMHQPLKNSPSLLWRRGSEKVHLRDEDKDDHRDQSPVFKNRTRMNPDAFQTGNLTLVLMNPTMNDTGSYTCVVKEDGSEVGHITVALSVVQRKEPPQPVYSPAPVGSIVGAVIGAVLVLLVTVPVVLWLLWKKNLSSEVKQVAVFEGSHSVSLPFHIWKFLLSSKSSVLWRREGRPSETVHLREEQGDVLSGQSDEFKDRTEMKPDALKTGNLTLVLKEPRVSDRGKYSCVVKVGWIKVRLFSEYLFVNGIILMVDEGDVSVSLTFHIRRSLLSSVSSVEWRRGTETVHLREQQGDVLSGQSDEFKDRTQMNPDALETGDLTLTLKYPRVSDCGYYSCEVKEGSTVVGHTSVFLTVKMKQVTVSEGYDFVSLPVHIRRSLLSSKSSVEWRRGTETVHLREEQGDVLSGQSDEFKDRTEMDPDALNNGNLTLVLKYPTVSDKGIYSCEVKEGSTVVRLISVELRVYTMSVTEPVPDPQSPLLSGAQAENLQLSGAAVKNSSEETCVETTPMTEPEPDSQSPLLSGAQAENLQLS